MPLISIFPQELDPFAGGPLVVNLVGAGIAVCTSRGCPSNMLTSRTLHAASFGKRPAGVGGVRQENVEEVTAVQAEQREGRGSPALFLVCFVSPIANGWYFLYDLLIEYASRRDRDERSGRSVPWFLSCAGISLFLLEHSGRTGGQAYQAGGRVRAEGEVQGGGDRVQERREGGTQGCRAPIQARQGRPGGAGLPHGLPGT